MFARKPISHDSVPGALAKVERYRLLNEPMEAESICRDILEVQPDNQAALVDLILSLTDQMSDESHGCDAQRGRPQPVPAIHPSRQVLRSVCRHPDPMAADRHSMRRSLRGQAGSDR